MMKTFVQLCTGKWVHLTPSAVMAIDVDEDRLIIEYFGDDVTGAKCGEYHAVEERDRLAGLLNEAAEAEA